MRIYFKFTNWLRVTRIVRQTRYSSEILVIDQNLQLLATDAEVEKDPVTWPITIPIENYKIYNRRSSKIQLFYIMRLDRCSFSMRFTVTHSISVFTCKLLLSFLLHLFEFCIISRQKEDVKTQIETIMDFLWQRVSILNVSFRISLWWPTQFTL